MSAGNDPGRAAGGGSGRATGGGAEVWPFLRCKRDYREGWRAHARAPEYEDAPFPVRIQSEADLEAVRSWRMLAWEDPFDEDGPVSPFWADAPMLYGEGSARATPLAAFLAEAGARLGGLRLLDGNLVLKAEKGGAAVQVLTEGDGPLLAGGGVRLYHDWGLRLPVNIDRLGDLWRVSGGPDPRTGRVAAAAASR